jgi:hypothetical protein
MPDTVNDYVQIRYGFDTVPDDEIGTTGWEPSYTINDTEYAKQFNKAYSVMKPDELLIQLHMTKKFLQNTLSID